MKGEKEATMSHTPGPWTVWDDEHPDDPRPGTVVMPEKAELGGGRKYACCGGGNVEANARLVAAAPDLLAVAEMVVELDLFNHIMYSATDFRHVADAARGAIAKAKGEE